MASLRTSCYGAEVFAFAALQFKLVYRAVARSVRVKQVYQPAYALRASSRQPSLLLCCFTATVMLSGIVELAGKSGKEQQNQWRAQNFVGVQMSGITSGVRIASSKNRPKKSPMKSMVFNFWNSATTKPDMAKQGWNQEPLFSLIAADLRPSSTAGAGQLHAA